MAVVMGVRRRLPGAVTRTSPDLRRGASARRLRLTLGLATPSSAARTFHPCASPRVPGGHRGRGHRDSLLLPPGGHGSLALRAGSIPRDRCEGGRVSLRPGSYRWWRDRLFPAGTPLRLVSAATVPVGLFLARSRPTDPRARSAPDSTAPPSPSPSPPLRGPSGSRPGRPPTLPLSCRTVPAAPAARSSPGLRSGLSAPQTTGRGPVVVLLSPWVKLGGPDGGQCPASPHTNVGRL